MHPEDDLHAPIRGKELRQLHKLGDAVLVDLGLRGFEPAHVLASDGLDGELSALVLILVPRKDTELLAILRNIEENAILLLALDIEAVAIRSEDPA